MKQSTAETFVRSTMAAGQQLIILLQDIGGDVPFPIKDCIVGEVGLETKRFPCGHEYLVLSFTFVDQKHEAMLSAIQRRTLERVSKETSGVEIHEVSFGKDH